MVPDAAQLSSLSTALDDLTRRVTTLAEAQGAGAREGIAADLYEVERHLQAGNRRLKALVDKL